MTVSVALKHSAHLTSTTSCYYSEKRRVSVLGSTGTIGCNTLDLIARSPDTYDVIALTANKNVALLAEQAIKHKARFAVIADDSKYDALKAELSGHSIEVASGEQAVVEAATHQADWIMAAIVGAAGLRPTLAAVRQGRCVALANKECLVAAGDLFRKEVIKANTTIIPVDSEHSAVFQSLCGQALDGIEKITLTASGGPFRQWPKEKLLDVTLEQALKHPNWTMGAKITIDSATLMNKGLELIEAWYMFPVTAEQLDVVVHPQSIIHCLVSYSDGSVLAQLSCPDMRTPIAYSLAWPQRMSSPTEKLDLIKLGSLTFEAPDEERFPCLRLAKEVLRAKGVGGAVLNAANEVAVHAFLERKLNFMSIPSVIEETLETFDTSLYQGSESDLENVIYIDRVAREIAHSIVSSRI